MKFEYQAIDEDGTIIRGIVEASNAKNVLSILLQKQLHPLDIRELTDSTVELSRLNNLRNRLMGKKVKEEVELPPRPTRIEEPKEKTQTDWTYFLFILMLLGLMVVAGLFG